MKRRVAILISGRGSNMAALIEAANAGGETVTLLGEVIEAKGAHEHEHRVVYHGHLDLSR